MKITRGIVSALQAAASAPKLVRASKTFTGAANLGATGVNELFTTTGAVAIDGMWIRCTTDLNDTVDGALFTIGVTGAAAVFADYSAIDLDTIDAGDFISVTAATDGYGDTLISGGAASSNFPAIVDNIIMTISTQAITSGVLEFYILTRPLAAGSGLALGAGMVAL